MDDSIDISEYEAFINATGAPVYYQPWYLEAVCRDGKWSIVTYQEDGQIKAVWPYLIKFKYGQSYLTLPPLAPYLGPWYIRTKQHSKNASWYAYEKKVLQELFKWLPKGRQVTFQMPPQLENWMPLYWNGCKQTTKYTYRINLLQTREEIWSKLTDSQRNTVKKAQSKFHISQELESDDMWRLIIATYKRQSIPIPFTKVLLDKLIADGIENEALDKFSIRTREALVGFAIILHDQNTSYLLITAKTDEDTSGAVSLAIWNSIVKAKEKGQNIYDFEGSMIPGVESFFRSFGGVMTPYHRITWTPNKVSEIILRLMNRI